MCLRRGDWEKKTREGPGRANRLGERVAKTVPVKSGEVGWRNRTSGGKRVERIEKIASQLKKSSANKGNAIEGGGSKKNPFLGSKKG